MQNASSANWTCREVLSTVEKTATVGIDISLQALMIRTAISPRLAMSVFLIISYNRRDSPCGCPAFGQGQARPSGALVGQSFDLGDVIPIFETSLVCKVDLLNMSMSFLLQVEHGLSDGTPIKQNEVVANEKSRSLPFISCNLQL